MPRAYRHSYDKAFLVAAVLTTCPCALKVHARPEVLGQRGTGSSDAKDPPWKRWPGKSSDAHVNAGSVQPGSSSSSSNSRHSAKSSSSSSSSSSSNSRSSSSASSSTSSSAKEPAWKRWPGKSGKSAEVYDDPDHSTDQIASSDKRHHYRLSPSASNHGDASSSSSSNDEKEGPWDAWTQPKLFEKAPGALGLSSITVAKASGSSASPAPVKPTQPYVLVNFPSADTYAKASQATGMNFAASGINRAVPNGNHKVPENNEVRTCCEVLFVVCLCSRCVRFQ